LNEIQDAAMKNQNLVPVELPEIDAAIINEIYTLYETDGEIPIEQELSTILSVANQCPYAGGKAVYQARALVHLFTDSVQYNDEAVCLQSGIFRVGEENKENQTLSFSLSPNPAKEKVRVNFSLKVDEPFTIQLLDITGREIKCQSFATSAKVELDITALPSGMYIVRASIPDSKQLSQKLTVIR
jgi:hypothetical protein